MDKFGFAAARPEESIVHGSQRPGYRAESVAPTIVDEWIVFMKQQGISRVCCLLGPDQLGYYKDLLDQYLTAFGEGNMCSAPIEDYHLCDAVTLDQKILPFLFEADASAARVLVHCSGGSGRTGHVLAAWLVRGRGMAVENAIQAVIASGRNPRESVQSGNATEAELHMLLKGSSNKTV